MEFTTHQRASGISVGYSDGSDWPEAALPISGAFRRQAGERGVGREIPPRGDVNTDGAVNSTDAVRIMNYLFLSGSAPTCRKAADANDDGKINTVDAIFALMHAFEERALPAPYEL